MVYVFRSNVRDLGVMKLHQIRPAVILFLRKL